MIKHIVMWTLKDEALGAGAKENGQKMIDMLMDLDGKIAELKKIEVTMNIFESAPATDIVLYSEFDSKKDLATYAGHPLHVECIGFIKEIVKERRVIDYEL